MFTTEITEGQMVRHRATGPVTLDGVAVAFHHWFEHPDFDPELPVLWDLRGQFIQASIADIAKLDQITNALTDKRRAADGRSAIIASTRAAEAALAGLKSNPNFVARFEIFQDEADALTWLGIPAEPVDDAETA